jgi:hypothetical protein
VRATLRAVEGAGGEAEALECVVEEPLAGGVETAVAAQVVRGHGGVDGVDGGAEASGLAGAGGVDPRGDGGGGLAGRSAELAERDRRHLDVQVDAVEERAGDAAAVALDQRRQAGAGMTRVAKMAAGTGLWALANRHACCYPYLTSDMTRYEEVAG